jgi:tetratricopeptide (TPR) repeat protein
MAAASQKALQLLQEAEVLSRHGSIEEAERRYRVAFKWLFSAKPGDPDLHYNFGVVLKGLDRPTADVRVQPGDVSNRLVRDALEQFLRSAALRPGADALTNAAVCLQLLERPDEALARCEQAIALDPALPESHIMAGNALQALGRFRESIARYETVIRLRPDSAVAYVALGDTMKALRRHDEAFRYYRAAQRLSPDRGEGAYYEAIARLRVGDYREGWRKFEARWRRDQGPRTRDLPQPLWLGDAGLAGKTILLHAEQGLGDTIQFARYVPMVAELGARVILEVPPALVPLMSSLAGVDKLISSEETVQGFDYHCPLMSLPLAFGTTVDTVPARIPYLSFPAETAATWRERLAHGSDRLVGLAWSGNPALTHTMTRDVALERLAPLLDVPGVRFVSLQRQLDQAERRWLAKRPNVVHPGAEAFATTAAIAAGLDLVISVDTAWAHWAGAIGKSVWVLLSHETQCDWRWLLDRDDSPWYPTARLFRQSAPGGWDEPVRLAAEKLAARQ